MALENEMYGICTFRGWMVPTSGPDTFFQFQQTPIFPFRTQEGAKAIAEDWLFPVFNGIPEGVEIVIYKQGKEQVDSFTVGG